MPTILNADNVTGGAIITGDASGVLELQAAGNRALSLNSSRAIGVGATPDYGTAGQVLTSSGSGAAAVWATAGAAPFITMISPGDNGVLSFQPAPNNFGII